MSVYASLSDVRTALRQGGKESPVWKQKMLHFVPDLPYVADRHAYLVEKLTGQTVLDLGCAGSGLSRKIQGVAAGYYGIDKVPGADWTVLDLDTFDYDAFPVHRDVTAVMAAELLEHLGNPGRLLDTLRDHYPAAVLWITVPQAGAYGIREGGHEMVNGDHVAWYSYTTLATLLRRYAYSIETARWYGGLPTKPEGLIVKAVNRAEVL